MSKDIASICWRSPIWSDADPVDPNQIPKRGQPFLAAGQFYTSSEGLFWRYFILKFDGERLIDAQTGQTISAIQPKQIQLVADISFLPIRFPS